MELLRKTKVGAEAWAQTRAQIKSIDDSSNFLLRWASRQRKIDTMAVEVETRMVDEFHAGFKFVLRIVNGAALAPVLFGLLGGTLQPSYYLLVLSGAMEPEKYAKIWEHAHPGMVVTGQLFVFLVWYDLSVYLRYPLMFYVVAPIFRRMGLFKVKCGGATVEQLRQGLKRTVPARPLGKSKLQKPQWRQ
jgi:hypothetical protein